MSGTAIDVFIQELSNTARADDAHSSTKWSSQAMLTLEGETFS
jgi:hypothetical protein